jgi:hypothetical protein
MGGAFVGLAGARGGGAVGNDQKAARARGADGPEHALGVLGAAEDDHGYGRVQHQSFGAGLFFR